MPRKATRDYCYRHTALRLKERYGLSVTTKEYDYLCALAWEKIKNKEYEKHIRFKDISLVVNLVFKHHRMLVVWSKKQGRIKTVLPVPR